MHDLLSALRAALPRERLRVRAEAGWRRCFALADDQTIDGWRAEDLRSVERRILVQVEPVVQVEYALYLLWRADPDGKEAQPVMEYRWQEDLEGAFVDEWLLGLCPRAALDGELCR